MCGLVLMKKEPISKFDELTRELDDEERKDLLDKLQKEKGDTHLPDSAEFSQIKSDIQAHRSYARDTMKDLSFIDRIIIWLKSVFSSKQEEDVVLEIIFENLRKQINKSCHGYINWSNRQLTSKFISPFLPLINFCKENSNQVLPLFQGSYYHDFLCTIFENEFTGKLLESHANLVPENIKEIHTEFFDKNTYDKERTNRQKAFFLNLESGTYDNFYKELSKMDSIIALLTFDFSRLLGEFLITDPDAPLTSNNIANLATAIKQLESLFAVIDQIDFSIKEISILYELLHYSKEHPLKQKDGKEGLVLYDIDLLGEIIEEIQRIKKKIPYMNIIKYYKKNLFYIFPAQQKQGDFIGFYKEHKRKKILNAWDEYYVKMKTEDLNKTLHTVLPGYSFETLRYLTTDLYSQINNLTEYKVTSIYKLNLGFEIIKRLTDLKMFIMLNKLLLKGKFVDDKVKASLSETYQTLTTGSEKISMFDNQFEHNNSLGKSVSHNLKLAIAAQKAGTEISAAAEYFEDIDYKGDKIYSELKGALYKLIEFYESITIIARRSSLPVSNLSEIGGVTSYDIVKDIEMFLNKIKIFMKLFKYVEFIY